MGMGEKEGRTGLSDSSERSRGFGGRLHLKLCSILTRSRCEVVPGEWEVLRRRCSALYCDVALDKLPLESLSLGLA